MTHDSPKTITITAKGADADMKPLIRQYEISDADDQKIFEASLMGVKDRLDCKLKANINDVLLLYAGVAYAILTCGKKNDYSKVVEGATTTAAAATAATAAEKHNNSKEDTNRLGEKIANTVSSLLTEQDVMIGVSDMAKHITIKVVNSNRDKNHRVISIQNPIKSGMCAGHNRKYLHDDGDENVV